MSRSWLPALPLLAAVAFVREAEGARRSEVTVSGTGDADGRPDRATAEIGVSVLRPGAAAAIEEASARLSSVVTALGQAGVEEARIQTRNLTVYPEYVHSEEGPRPGGMRATFTVAVDLRDLDRAGTVLDAALRAAGDDAVLQSFQLGFVDTTALREQARSEAWKHARAAAEQIASLSGSRLGRPVRVVESTGGGGGPPMPYAKAESLQMDVQPGTMALVVTVDATFELLR